MAGLTAIPRPSVLRRADLDRGKSFAILLVVLGHLVARADPPGLSWYEPLRALLYSFHIPFLFYLSGYAGHLSGSDRRWGRRYRVMLERRAQRLLLPALLVGLAIVVGKAAVAPLVAVDNRPATLWTGVADLLWHTDRSAAQSVWYLVVLFGLVALAPPAGRWLGGRIALFAALGLMLLPAPPYLYADRFCADAGFFALGIVAASLGTSWLGHLDRHRAVLLGGFTATLLVIVIATSWGGLSLPRQFRMIGTSLVALPALHALMRALPRCLARVLDALTPYAFAVYLLNTICIGLAKGLLMLALPWTAANFPLYAAALTAAGILGPILLQQPFVGPLRWLERPTG